jgi:hypothetical protein
MNLTKEQIELIDKIEAEALRLFPVEAEQGDCDETGYYSVIDTNAKAREEWIDKKLEELL